MKKIGITSTGQGLDSMTSPSFGKSPYFCIIEWDNGQITGYAAMINPRLGAGCGTIGAKHLAGTGIEAIVTAHIGDNSYNELKASSIEVYTMQSHGKVEDIAIEYFNGNLHPLTPNAPCSPGKQGCGTEKQQGGCKGKGGCGKGGCCGNKP